MWLPTPPPRVCGLTALPGFPSLYTLKFTYELKMAGVVLFNMESKGESYIVTPAPSTEVRLTAGSVRTQDSISACLNA